jgi:hypothetical protein
VVAVIQLKSLRYDEGSPSLPRTRFDADIIEVIKGSGAVSTGLSISVMRYGGVRERAGELMFIEEGGFAPWVVGQTLLVFLKWYDRFKSYTLAFGPAAAFELNTATNKVRVFTTGSFAARHNGGDVAALLAEVRAAR